MTDATIDVVEFNVTTGETIERAFTPEEKAANEAMRAQFLEEKAAAEAELARVDALKASAKAKLIAGEPLTEEEASLLVI